MSTLSEHPSILLPQDAVPLETLFATPCEVAASWPKDEPIIALIGNGEMVNFQHGLDGASSLQQMASVSPYKETMH